MTVRRFAVAAVAVTLAIPAAAFELKSPEVADGKTLPMAQVANMFGCKGGNTSPALTWSDPPAGTQSFALSVYDPDAPTGSGWWHWSVFDIPATATSLPKGAGAADGLGLPKGAIQTHSDYGTAGFGGACPPPGPVHHYVITLTALKTRTLGAEASASNALVGFMTRANSLGTATITALYSQ